MNQHQDIKTPAMNEQEAKEQEEMKTQDLTPSTFDFKESDKVDPTHGWFPFVFLIAIVPILLALILVAGYFILT